VKDENIPVNNLVDTTATLVAENIIVNTLAYRSGCNFEDPIYEELAADTVGVLESGLSESLGDDPLTIMRDMLATVLPDEDCVVAVDIKPGSCPNPVNRTSGGFVPVSILGSSGLDVSSIDLSSISLARADGVGGSVEPNEGPPGPRSRLEDTGTPFDGDLCDCHDLEGDGIIDLSMKFRTQLLVSELELESLSSGDEVEIIVRGSLIDGSPFEGRDCIVITGGD
jgi:hypothetical protein